MPSRSRSNFVARSLDEPCGTGSYIIADTVVAIRTRFQFPPTTHGRLPTSAIRPRPNSGSSTTCRWLSSVRQLRRHLCPFSRIYPRYPVRSSCCALRSPMLTGACNLILCPIHVFRHPHPLRGPRWGVGLAAVCMWPDASGAVRAVRHRGLGGAATPTSFWVLFLFSHVVLSATSPHTRATTPHAPCGTHSPCSLNADWCLHSDIMTDARLFDAPLQVCELGEDDAVARKRLLLDGLAIYWACEPPEDTFCARVRTCM